MTPLDEKTLKPLHVALQAREAELLGEINAARDADIDATSARNTATTDVSDFKDQAGRQQRNELRDAEVERDRRELADVRAALSRLAKGTYGVCIDCEKPLELARLTALPAAARCIPCQMVFESKLV